LPVRRTLERLGIPRATFYRWYDLYRALLWYSRTSTVPG
jgi:hypothetical protein